MATTGAVSAPTGLTFDFINNSVAKVAQSKETELRNLIGSLGENPSTADLLEQLIAFDTQSFRSNLELRTGRLRNDGLARSTGCKLSGMRQHGRNCPESCDQHAYQGFFQIAGRRAGVTDVRYDPDSRRHVPYGLRQALS